MESENLVINEAVTERLLKEREKDRGFIHPDP